METDSAFSGVASVCSEEEELPSASAAASFFLRYSGSYWEKDLRTYLPTRGEKPLGR